MGPMYPIYSGNVSSSQIQANKGMQKANDLKVARERFSQFLLQETATAFGISFSKHAVKRIMQRQIVLPIGQMERISNGIERLKEKGVKEGLILCGDLAFVVNPKNKCVITCMDKTRLQEDVFTNIDGVVIV